MSGSAIADQIAPELPYLRRFARALCGTQDSGDQFVVQTLEAIIADNGLFNTKLSPKVALYQVFLKIWNALPLNRDTEPLSPGPRTSTDQRLEQITPVPRQAFLLTAVEEFSEPEVASILGKSEIDVRNLIQSAATEISAQISSRIMIIEDEPMIALDIETLISDIGHTSAGIATTRDEALALAKSSRPDLILSDIQLADGSSGIDAVADISKVLNVPVIFITAYPERLLTGERAEPAFLITKPFQPSMVKAIVSQALFFSAGQPAAA